MDISDIACQSEVDRIQDNLSDLTTKVEFILKKMGYEKKWIAESRYTYPAKKEIFNSREELDEFFKKYNKKKGCGDWDYSIYEDFVLENENSQPISN